MKVVMFPEKTMILSLCVYDCGMVINGIGMGHSILSVTLMYLLNFSVGMLDLM